MDAENSREISCELWCRSTAKLLPLDGHLTFHSRDSLSPLQSPPSLFPSLHSPPSIRYTVCLHAQRVNPNPFTQLYPSYIGVLENQTPL